LHFCCAKVPPRLTPQLNNDQCDGRRVSWSTHSQNCYHCNVKSQLHFSTTDVTISTAFNKQQVYNKHSFIQISIECYQQATRLILPLLFVFSFDASFWEHLIMVITLIENWSWHYDPLSTLLYIMLLLLMVFLHQLWLNDQRHSLMDFSPMLSTVIGSEYVS
jgi:hypothetical protein